MDYEFLTFVYVTTTLLGDVGFKTISKHVEIYLSIVLVEAELKEELTLVVFVVVFVAVVVVGVVVVEVGVVEWE